jgi:hypothetical protein
MGILSPDSASYRLIYLIAERLRHKNLDMPFFWMTPMREKIL